ncbi:DUF1648 domain-containing protein [Algoriphagus chordae]|uniref:Uncharacterized protein DUF1648 n=1 Tax=Algoriphagus chordae TaxID=237019 RepID=A0A2W7RD06_9BACT|nr:DUF1648 domain-containing protein [Algoriphagus chordae]PZX52059.1 uncharacterized protein DUF1648 [Algoriphagus chordae]
MEERPRIKLKLGIIDIVLEILGWLAILAIWGLVIAKYSSLPDSIPTHFNAAGQPDSFGGKATLFVLPIMGTLTFLGLTFLNMFPEIFNYPTDITAANASAQYLNSTRMMRYLKMILVVIFGLIVFNKIQIATELKSEMGIWFIPVSLLLMFVPLIYFISNSFRISKKSQVDE